MKFLILIPVLCLSWPLWAQDDLTITVLSKDDSIKSRYIREFPDHFFIAPLLKQRHLDFEISDLPAKSKRLNYKSNSPYSLGFAMYLFEVGLELTAAIPLAEKSKEIYGPSDARDIQLVLFTKKWGLDMYRQKYAGFYIDDPAVEVPDDAPYPQRSDIRTKNIGITWSYIFNNKKFSLRAVSNYAERQIKSAGSFVVFTSIGGFTTSGDSAILGDAYRDYYGVDSKIDQIKSTALSIMPGYTYSFVHKGFFINATLAVGPAHNWLSYRSEDGNTKKDVEFRANFVARIALGYNGDRFFGGMSFASQAGNADFDTVQLRSSRGTFKLLFGYRFREVGFLKRRLADLPKAFGIGV